MLLQNVGKYHEFSCTITTGGKSSSEEMHNLEFANIVIATPGRLLWHLDNTPMFDVSNLKMFVLDEVDMLLEMGFYDDLVKIIQSLNVEKQTLLFSATLTASKIMNLQKLVLKDPEVIELN
mmetsp:Transcript_56079/g.47258  ORF Transcript_56079/g.47258 Transcript_56079/m.47258 type:complete len:121 (+) Transcript_56079:550-912(+)